MKSISSVKQNLRGWRGTSTSSRRTNSFYPTPRATKGNGNDKGNYTTSAGDGGGDGGSDGGSTASESPSGSSPLVKLGKRVSKSFRERIAFPPMPPILTGNTPTGAEAASGEEQVMTSSKVESPPLLNWNLEELKLKEGMGFGFSAGGLLFPYFVGNAVALRRLGLINEETLFAGSSAGSLISACIVCDLDHEMLMAECLNMYRDLRKEGTIGNVRSITEIYANVILPDDAHIRANGRLHVSIVRISQQSPFLQSVYVNEFHSKEDLIQALLTSSHVPLYMNTKMTSTYRGQTCVDGGLGANFIPKPPCTKPVTVCCFPSMPERFESDIAPGKHSECAYSLTKMLNWAVLPPSEDKIMALFEMGVTDVLDWAATFECE